MSEEFHEVRDGEAKMSDKDRGLYNKYEVTRLNDHDGKHDECRYFVLDLVHDKFAIPALKVYAKACRDKYPKLAEDLLEEREKLMLALGIEDKII